MERKRLSVPTLQDWVSRTVRESTGSKGLEPSLAQGGRAYLTGMEEGRVFRILYQDDRKEFFVSLNNPDTRYPGRYFKLDESQAMRFRAGEEVKVMQTTILQYKNEKIEQEVLYTLHSADYPVPNKFRR